MDLSIMSPNLQVTPNVLDDASDYGDFTLDEQEVLIELLADITSPLTADEAIDLTDIEDYEEYGGLRLPKTLGNESRMQQQPQPQVAAQNQMEDQTPCDVSTDNTNGTSGRTLHIVGPCADMLTSA